MKRFSLALLAAAGFAVLSSAPASAQAVRAIQASCYKANGETVCDLKCQPEETILSATCNKHARPGPQWGQGGEVMPTYMSRSEAQCRAPEKPGFGDPMVGLCASFKTTPH